MASMKRRDAVVPWKNPSRLCKRLDSCGRKSSSGREPRSRDPSAGLYAKLHLHLARQIPQRRLGALKARALKGRPMKSLPPRWVALSHCHGQSPLQFRFEFALWTRDDPGSAAGAVRLKLSVASVGRLLKQLGLSCQRPSFRAIEQDPSECGGG